MFEQHQTKHKANQSQATERRVHNGVIDFFDMILQIEISTGLQSCSNGPKTVETHLI